MLNAISLFGLLVLGAIAWAAGGCRRPVPWQTVGGSGLLMLLFGVIVFLIEPTRTGLIWLNDLVVSLLGASRSGAEFLFGPLALAWLLGIEAGDLGSAGRLLGKRLLMTEVVAYRDLGQLMAAGSIAPRSALVLSYALCGFAPIPSMGIFVGGIAALAPSRRNDLAALGLRALLASTLATLMTGCLAGLLYHGQQGLLGNG